MVCLVLVGVGIDLRRRGIWTLLAPGARLEERALTPGPDLSFPGADWLIGNHSDELTPWLPVAATRSGPRCAYFALPCCFFTFTGRLNTHGGTGGQYQVCPAAPARSWPPLHCTPAPWCAAHGPPLHCAAASYILVVGLKINQRACARRGIWTTSKASARRAGSRSPLMICAFRRQRNAVRWGLRAWEAIMRRVYALRTPWLPAPMRLCLVRGSFPRWPRTWNDVLDY